MSDLFSPTHGVQKISIEEEMRKSFLSYSMSVIVSRALPDVRDGLKPVHRRILWSQHNQGNEWNKKYLKSARVVGEIMGKYHPHGNLAIYDALVRLAQDFSMRLPLEDGQGNFGSMDGDPPAADRYTEIRMSKAASAMLADIDSDTVEFTPNYDGSEKEPVVLPARFPNVLVNGSSGIAVGMATNIPPHNLGEVIDATIHLVDDPTATTFALNQYIQGPDFPTGGIVMGKGGILSANENGRGSITLRGKVHVEEAKGKNPQTIVISEIPYMVNKAKLVERIAELVREKIIAGISDLRDESDRTGIRVAIELKRDGNADIILNQLYKHTPLQTSFGYNMLALDQGRPKLMGIRDILTCFVAHREEVITRRTRFELKKARDRAHILVGLAIAVANIDEVIAIIRNAPDSATAKAKLIAKSWAASSVQDLLTLLGEEAGDLKKYHLSELQAQAILDLRLHRLTGLEREKIIEEAKEIEKIIQALIDILSNRAMLLKVLKDELIQVKEQFATPRRTVIEDAGADVNMEDLIPQEDMVVTLSSDGYVKRQPITTFRAQRRGGKGKQVANLRDEEQMASLFVANTHDPLLFFTSIGKVYTMKVYGLPLASVQARGKAFVNLLPLAQGEMVSAVIPIPRDEAERVHYHLLFATKEGLIRKTPLTAFANVHSNGIKGMGLNDGDTLIDVRIIKNDVGDVIISTRKGQAVRFEASDLRPIASRTGMGVKGVNLRKGDEVISMHNINPQVDTHILSITENGFGKRTVVDDFPAKSRGTMGVISIQTTDRNGAVVTSMPVGEGDQAIIATSDGQLIRMRVDDISSIGRNTQGVRLLRLDGSEGGSKGKVRLVCRIPAAMLDKSTDSDSDAETTSLPMETEAADTTTAS